MASLFAIIVCAQDVKITGNVTSSSDKLPLIGVTVRVAGVSGGAITDLDGNYTINAKADATLEFSMIGYEKQTIKVNGRKVINVTLRDMASDLNEVVVIGYGSVKKSDLTSSISAVKGEDLEKLSTGNVMNALQAR